MIEGPVDLFDRFLAQAGLIQSAWMPFLLVVGIAAFLMWKLVQREYATRLANADSTIAMLRERLSRAETNETMAIAVTGQAMEAKAEPTFVPHPEPQLAPQSEPQSVPPSTQSIVTPPADASAEVKEYVDEDFNGDTLLEILKNKTGLQAQSLLVPHFGKWMRVKGIVRAANALPTNGALLGVQTSNSSNLTFCIFRPVPAEVTQLDVGDAVEIEGRLDRVNGNSLMLEDGVLLSAEKGAKAS
jgi:cytoskeletal protein RodZ